MEAQTEGWQPAGSRTFSFVLVALGVSHGGGREAGACQLGELLSSEAALRAFMCGGGREVLTHDTEEGC